MAGFEVIAAALAPWDHLEIFSDYYLRMGAERVSLFFDGPLQRKHLSANVRLVECDDRFWADRGGRLAGVEDRQRAIYNFAYATALAKWVLIVDIDEFVFGEMPLAEAFLAAEGTYESIRFNAVEAVFDAGQDVNRDFGACMFRKSYNRYLAAILPHVLYPGLGHVFIRGLLGHSRGKQAVRSGLENLSLDIHDGRRDGRALRELDMSRRAGGPNFHLAHFDAISCGQWREKWRRRLLAHDTWEMGRKRERQADLFARACKQNREDQLFRRLYALGPLQRAVLRALNLIIEQGGPDLGTSLQRASVSSLVPGGPCPDRGELGSVDI